jgi:hypothetical protein
MCKFIDKELKDFLDEKVNKYNTPFFLESDHSNTTSILSKRRY